MPLIHTHSLFRGFNLTNYLSDWDLEKRLTSDADSKNFHITLYRIQKHKQTSPKPYIMV